MKKHILRHIMLALALSASALYANTSLVVTGTPHTFEAGKGEFLLDGEPFVVKAAELHYPRIPAEYWKHRIRMCKAMGMNTICLYVFWNAHEPEQGQFDFEGQNNLRAFVQLCRDNDMKVILRPGPYVCAEWEMGGLPWWLLRHEGIRLRENDPYFIECVDNFQQKVAQQLEGLMARDGGPVIMVQVENEYGSYGEDKEYIANIRDMLRRNFGDDVTMFQCDWASNFTKNGLPDLVWTMNFGTGADIDSQFSLLRELRPDSPLMCSEFWSGWFDKWGANHETRPAADMIAGIDEMLSKGISFSLYMAHGGTNWGHWAGANSPGYAPDVTSYDYDAPISEAGHTTPKFHMLRRVMASHNGGLRLPKIPAPIPVGEIAEFALDEVAPLWENLPQPVESADVETIEQLGFGYGSVLYRTEMPPLDVESTLKLEAHDYAQVFINGEYVGTLDRRLGHTTLQLPAAPRGGTLNILVEAMGRINFGRAIKDYKGIVSDVELIATIGGRPFVCNLKGWKMYPMPDSEEFYAKFTFGKTSEGAKRVPGLYRGTFNVSKPADTFLDFSSWGKGLVFVNGHPLGRIWEIGPQQTLYMPGCWLRKGENEIMVFDIIGPERNTVRGLKNPIIDSLKQAESITGESKRPDLEAMEPVLTSHFAPGNGWQSVALPHPVTGRYLAIEALDSNTGSDQAAIAELYLLDTDGNRISREQWSAGYSDSHDAAHNRSVDKIFDLQESTFWSTAPSSPFPHTVVIDLGSPQTVSAIEMLPRMEPGAPASIGSFRLFLW